MDDATTVNLLQRVLDSIVHHQQITNAENDDNRRHYKKIIELYPLSDQPHLQLIPNVYKNHIHGIFFALKVLKQHGENIRINKDAIQLLNQSLRYASKPYSLTSSRKGKTSERIQKIVLEITNTQPTQPVTLSQDDLQLLQNLRNNYIQEKATSTTSSTTSSTTAPPQELEEEETPDPDHSLKRPRSVSNDDQPKNPKMKKVHIPLRNSIEVAVVPRNHVVTTIYEHKKLQTKADQVSELKAKNAELEIRNAELETIIKKIGTNQLTELSQKVKQLDLDCKRLHRATKNMIRCRNRKLTLM
jgi:hypothetical protein